LFYLKSPEGKFLNTSFFAMGRCVSGYKYLTYYDLCYPDNSHGASYDFSVSDNPCYIPLGQSSCSTTISWGGASYTLVSGKTGYHKSPQTIQVGFGIYRLELKTASRGIPQGDFYVSGVCASGSWDGSKCSE
jgi:hypothetical protein